jgi:glycosyltransferase involved in cell wall biosynthesis
MLTRHYHHTSLPMGLVRSSSSKRPLHVCHLAYTFCENDHRAMRYAQTLADRNDRVDVIALRRPGQQWIEQSDGIRKLHIQTRTGRERRAALYFLKILWFFILSWMVLTFFALSDGFDVVHVHNVPDFLVLAAFIPKLFGSRVNLDIHDALPELYAGKFKARSGSLVWRALLFIERISCRFVDYVIVANDVWKTRIAQRASAAQKCMTLLNYPDLRVFKRSTAKAKAHRDKFVILYPGSLNAHQGVDVAIRAFAHAKDRTPNAELHIVGEGQSRSELQQLAETLGVADRVTILDPVPIDEVSRLMADADLGAEPKLADSFANEALSTKILDFMACGVPVVVSRTLVHDLYFDDSIVTFFEPGDVEALADAFTDFYLKPRPTRQVRNAYAFAVRNSWQEWASQYVRVVDMLCGRSAPHCTTA